MADADGPTSPTRFTDSNVASEPLPAPSPLTVNEPPASAPAAANEPPASAAAPSDDTVIVKVKADARARSLANLQKGREAQCNLQGKLKAALAENEQLKAQLATRAKRLEQARERTRRSLDAIAATTPPAPAVHKTSAEMPRITTPAGPPQPPRPTMPKPTDAERLAIQLRYRENPSSVVSPELDWVYPMGNVPVRDATPAALLRQVQFAKRRR